jgi:hypothetical protein
MRLPSLDICGARLNLARFTQCEIGSIWATSASLNSATFRDCGVDEFTLKNSTSQGLLLRQRTARKPSDAPLCGPWMFPSPSAHLSIRARFEPYWSELVFADDDNVISVLGGKYVHCWATGSGQLLWMTASALGIARMGEKWSINRKTGVVEHNAGRTVGSEKFNFLTGENYSGELTPLMEALLDSPATRYRLEPRLPLGITGQLVLKYKLLSGPLAGCTRYFVHGAHPSTACFDAEGRLVDYDEEAADTWLRYLGNGYPQPVEAAWLELDEFGRALGPKKG